MLELIKICICYGIFLGAIQIHFLLGLSIALIYTCLDIERCKIREREARLLYSGTASKKSKD